jgi:hypothetical protein
MRRPSRWFSLVFLLGFLVLLIIDQNCAATRDDTTMRDAINSDIDALIVLLQSDDATDRKRAAYDLGRNTQKAKPALDLLKRLMYEDSNPEVKIAAAQAVALIEGHGKNAVPALRKQLQADIERVPQLQQQVDESSDDASLNALFERLDNMEKIINVMGSIGAASADAAPDLIRILKADLGHGYHDLVPSIGRALQSMGPAAKPVLRELENFSHSERGKQNRDSINAAIDSIKGKSKQLPPEEPLTDID